MKKIQKQLERFTSDEKTPSEDRLVMLCDGIFAIAITLLVLDIGINPHVSSHGVVTSSDVDASLGQLVKPGIGYLVSFFIIAMYWRSHRTLMQVVQRLDNTFITLTFIFLAFIAFFPVTSKLIGYYGDTGSIVVIYTLGLSGCSMSAFILWFYATWKHRLVSPDLPRELIDTRNIALLLNPLIYCASLLLLLVIPKEYPYLICFSWVLIGYSHRAVRYIYARWLAKPVHALLHHEQNGDAAPAFQQRAKKLPDTPAMDNREQKVPEEAAPETFLPNGRAAASGEES